MSDTKHTPGPWFADGPQICGNGTTADVEGCVVARVTTGYDVNRFTAKLGGNGDVFKANALLMAASPELLDFVREQFNQTACICRLSEIQLAMGTNVECTHCKAGRLIAKATEQS